MTTSTSFLAIILLEFSVGCLVVASTLFSIIIVKSHCCDRQYSRKQRIFLYLLLASLGYSIIILLRVCGIELFRDGVYWGFAQLVNMILCWAALYVCFEVYTTLRRTEFHCLRFKFHTVVEDVCILIVVITISTGYAAADLFLTPHHFGRLDFDTALVLYLPLVFIWCVVTVSVALVLVQLCLACRRVEDGQVANRLRRPAIVTVTLLVMLVGYIVGGCAAVGTHFNRTLLLVVGIGYTITPHMFGIFFGWKMLQDLGRQCCCRRYRRRRGYGQIPGQEERGVLSAQSPVLRTTRTYYTCDDHDIVTNTGIYHTCDDVRSITRTYDTCDESKSAGWSQGFSVKLPPLPQ